MITKALHRSFLNFARASAVRAPQCLPASLCIVRNAATENGPLRRTGCYGGQAAFTLLEALVALGIGGIALIALYAGFTYGFATIEVTRQDLRATEIILQRLERIRLCSFSQITNVSVNPLTITDYYDPADQTNGSAGVPYTVTFNATVPAAGTLPDAYRTNMLLVTVGASWTSGKLQHSRSMQTYVAQNGIQSYVSAGGL
jgi:type II secretory pathway pseudopilin PulG